MTDRLHRNELIRELKERFPNLTKALNAEMGILTFEVEVFRRFTQKMINDGERDVVHACFDIARMYYANGDSKVRDAIDTCFVEDLEFDDTKKRSRLWAWDLFPTELKIAYKNFHDKLGP